MKTGPGPFNQSTVVSFWGTTWSIIETNLSLFPSVGTGATFSIGKYWKSHNPKNTIFISFNSIIKNSLFFSFFEEFLSRNRQRSTTCELVSRHNHTFDVNFITDFFGEGLLVANGSFDDFDQEVRSLQPFSVGRFAERIGRSESQFDP